MNRLEFLLLLLTIAVAVLIVIKSRWFDRIVASLLKGTQSTTATDLHADSAQVKKTAEQLSKDLAAKEAQIAADKAKLNSL